MPARTFIPPPGQSQSLDRIAEAERYNEWLFARVRPLLGDRVLDFGAGVGTFTERIAASAEVVALEPDPSFIPELERRFADDARVTVVAGDTETVPALGHFDTAICFNVLEHIADDAAAVGRLAACLSPGGHLLVLVPAHRALFGEIDRNVGHERRYGRAQLASRLRDAALEPQELRYVNPLGAFGWLVSSRILRRKQVPPGPLKIYDALVPLLRPLDRLQLPCGLSLWAVARKSSS